MGEFVQAMASQQGVAAIAEIGAGAARQSELKSQSKLAELEARQELLIGEADALEIERELNDALAASIASAGARGVSAGGSGEAAARELIAEASFAQRVSQRTAQISATTKRIEAGQLRAQGSAALASGIIAGATRVGQEVTRRRERGTATTVRTSPGGRGGRR